MIDGLRDRVVNSTSSLFSHGPQPLKHTMSYRGDPGLLGPDSVSWEVIGDVTAFVGGIRALVVQSAHPEVVAGVDEHSQYKTDPLGRLSRTSVYVTETTYGALPEVEEAVAVVRRAHRPVHGVSERQLPYSAGQPAMAAWVHNVLTDSFLVAFQAYGPRTLDQHEADQFVCEQARIGALLGADPLPTSAEELSSWILHHPGLSPTAAQARAVDFLCDPPLPLPVKFGYRLLFKAAVATLPANIAEITALYPRSRGKTWGRRNVAALRWALGSSPSWHVALVRAGAPVPGGRFRQRLPESVQAQQGDSAG
ncbi:MAG: oxygenase MpaB family protein [Acidimicrobiales bacterium]